MKARSSFRFEPTATTTSPHDGFHKRKEAAGVFVRGHRADFML